MPIEHTSILAGAYPAQRAWLLDAAVPPQTDAARNTGREPDEMCRAFVISLWEHALSGISGHFERLAFLGSLRDREAGYRHYGLELPLGADASEVIRSSHEGAFRDWISLSVEQQKADLEAYLSSAQGHRNGALKKLLDSEFQESLIPASASGHERALYRADFEAVLRVIVASQAGPATATLDLARDEA